MKARNTRLTTGQLFYGTAMAPVARFQKQEKKIGFEQTFKTVKPKQK